MLVDVVLEGHDFDVGDGQHFEDVGADPQMGNWGTRVDVDGVFVDTSSTGQQLFVGQVECHLGLGFDVDGHDELIGIASTKFIINFLFYLKIKKNILFY